MMSITLDEILQSTTVSYKNGRVILAEVFVNPREFNKDRFVNLMQKLVENTSVNYKKFREYMQKFEIYNYIQNLENAMPNIEAYIKETADKKYKKEFYRNKFVTDMMSSYKVNSLMKMPTNSWNDLSNVHFDGNFGSQNYVSSFTFNSLLSESVIENIFNSLSNSAEFKYALGIRLSYKPVSKDSLNWFGHIDLEVTLSPEGQKKVKENENTLTEAIHEFYKNTTYFGE